MSDANNMMGTRVYIGRVSYHAKEKDVERFFRGFGRIKDIMLKNGYGFVEFEDYRDADDAVYELNGKELRGERVIVEHARGLPRSEENWRDRDRGGSRFPPRRRGGRDNRYGPPTRTEFRLVVENLSSRVSWQDLKDYMRQAGEVTYADAHKDRKNEGSAVTGVVEFATLSDMKNALDKLDDTEVNGRRIRLVEDKPRKHRRSSRSHSRSRSRSRSRRRSRSRSRSRSGSHHSRSRSEPSRSRSRSRSRHSASRSPSKSRSKSRSRSHSPRSRSLSQNKSQSRSPSPSRSKSRTPEPKENGSPADVTQINDKDAKE